MNQPQDLFGRPLVADPAIALQPLNIAFPKRTGPLHKVQFVIEFVGPRTMPAGAVAQLMSQDWYSALGKPEMFVMRPSDLQWQRLTPAPDGSYDSLALAWNLITPDGRISQQSAAQLFAFAERFGPTIQRRPMPLPHPSEVDAVVKQLVTAHENLDLGFALSVMSRSGAFLERDIWIICARLGLDFAPGGSFDWRTPQHPFPLLSVTPIGHADAFSLGNVQRDVSHAGVTVGFSIPLCVAPAQALEASFYCSEKISQELGGEVLDEADRPLSDRTKARLRENMRQGLGLFAAVGITTGSLEAIRLFAA